MSFNSFFFKKTALLFLCCFAPFSFSSEHNLSRVFKDLTCVKDVTRHYPSFLKGNLNLDQQDRFFNCVWGFLDSVVNKKIITHTSERDHFTRHEIFTMFHILFEYEEDKSKQFTQQLLFFKKLLIGGSIDTFKDEELSDLLNLVFDYKEAYYIIHKEIPVFKKLFRGERIHPERKDKTLEQLRKTALLLAQAYEREEVSYTIEDLSQYPQYMGQESVKWSAFLSLLQNLFEGALFPKKEIEGESWSLAVNTIRRSFDFLFYHNEYLLKELTEIQFAYNSLSAIETFLPLLTVNESLFLEKGFPLRNLDNILKASLEFLIPQENPPGFLSHFKDEKRLRFLTRAFFALSLSPKASESFDPAVTSQTESNQKSVIVDWETGLSVVSFSFPDSKFHFFEEGFTEEKEDVDYFISSEKIKKIEEWIEEYKRGILNIHNGFEEELSKEKGMEHWLDLFFGWDKDNQMIYGSFQASDNRSKMMHLLSYQAFLSLFLSHYAPAGYFDSEEQELSIQQWRLIVSDLAPFLFAAFGVDGFQSFWKDSLEELFTIADLFLNSSDLNEKLNRKELLDLFIHLSSALQQSQKAFSNLLSLCSDSDFSNCSADAFLDRSEMLKSYPRFRAYIFPVKRGEYRRNIKTLLSDLEKEGSSFQLLELFFLIQIMEVNYYQRINTDFDFNLDSDELFVFADSFKEKIFLTVPYLYNADQGLAYILYSFQSKKIPFFTGDEFESIRFTQWYLNPQARSSFSITPNDFHNLAFEFYNLYKRF